VKIRIHKGRVAVSGALRAHVERRLGFALGGFGERVGRVLVRLSRREPAQGQGQQCEIEVSLSPRILTVMDGGADSFVAVENAADRLGRAIGRALERERAWGAGEPPMKVPSERVTDGLTSRPRRGAARRRR
jgi:ribosome hibernation promoting factor